MYGTTIDDEDKEFSSSVEGVNSDGEKYTASENEGRWEKVQRRRRGRRERVWTTTLASLVASIPAVIVGYTIAFSSSALLDLTGDLAPGIPSGYGFSSALSATFAALAPVGAALGGLVAGPISDRWGRKNALILCGVPFFVGYLILSYAQYAPTATSFKTTALTGRFFTGVGVGWTLMSSSGYIIEISSAKLRGVFGSFVQIALSTGLLLNYSIGSIPNFPYYYTSLVAAGIIAFFEVVMVTMYETPRWLVAHGNISKAYQSLRWLRGPYYDIDSEIQENMAANSSATSIWSGVKEFRKRSVLVPLILVLFLVFFQQAGGLNAIDSYAASLFQKAGVANPRVTATYTIGSASVAVSLMAVFVIDLIGRKILLIISGSGMAVGTLLLGVQYYITRPSLCSGHNSSNSTNLQNFDDSETKVCNSQYGALAIVSIMIYIIGFSIAWGPVPWILVSELTPLRVRGVASGVATVINWGTAAVVAGIYPPFSDAVRPWFAWWTFTLLNISAVLFSIFFLKETKGKTLEEIENYYKTHLF